MSDHKITLGEIQREREQEKAEMWTEHVNNDTDDTERRNNIKWEEHPLKPSFEDLETGMRVRYKGEVGWITRKGDDVIGDHPTRHIKIVLKGDAGRDAVKLHENTATRYLRMKKTLWADLDGQMKEAVDP